MFIAYTMNISFFLFYSSKLKLDPTSLYFVVIKKKLNYNFFIVSHSEICFYRIYLVLVLETQQQKDPEN